MLLNCFRKWVLVLLVIAAPAGWAAEAYQLGAGDIVRISVYNHPDLETLERVAADGTISFPLLGEVSVAGKTERETEVELASLLQKKNIVKSPQVNVIVEDNRSQRVSVLGNVAKPGVYAISPGSTVVDLIAEAGGLTDEAGDIAVVTRNDGAGRKQISVDVTSVLKEGNPANDIAAESGDRIFVPRMPVFYIYGQVNRPNAYRLDRGMTVMQAISIAGGLTDKGTERGLTIKRAGADADNPEYISAEPTRVIQENDVIYVKESLF